MTKHPVLETRFVLNTRPFDFGGGVGGADTGFIYDRIRTDLTKLFGFEDGEDFFILIPGRDDPEYGSVLLIVTNLSCVRCAVQQLEYWHQRLAV